MTSDENVIQIAGIHSDEEAHIAVDAGANWLGFPLRLPSGKDDISEYDAKKVIASLPTNITSVLITYLTEAEEIAKMVEDIGFDAVQLHGEIETKEVIKLKEKKPGLLILKSLVVAEDNVEDLLIEQKKMEPHVDMFLTDTYNPRTGAMGATGLQHDWASSKKIVENTKLPVIIAGGLNPDNVYDAVLAIKPFGVDAHTGLEDPNTGLKTFEKVSKFKANALRAFEKIKNER